MTVTGTQQRVYGTLVTQCILFLDRFAITFTDESPKTNPNVLFGSDLSMLQCGYLYDGFLSIIFYNSNVIVNESRPSISRIFEINICKRDNHKVVIETYGIEDLDTITYMWFNAAPRPYVDVPDTLLEDNDPHFDWILLNDTPAYKKNVFPFTEHLNKRKDRVIYINCCTNCPFCRCYISINCPTDYTYNGLYFNVCRDDNKDLAYVPSYSNNIETVITPITPDADITKALTISPLIGFNDKHVGIRYEYVFHNNSPHIVDILTEVNGTFGGLSTINGKDVSYISINAGSNVSSINGGSLISESALYTFGTHTYLIQREDLDIFTYAGEPISSVSCNVRSQMHIGSNSYGYVLIDMLSTEMYNLIPVVCRFYLTEEGWKPGSSDKTKRTMWADTPINISIQSAFWVSSAKLKIYSAAKANSIPEDNYIPCPIWGLHDDPLMKYDYDYIVDWPSDPLYLNYARSTEGYPIIPITDFSLTTGVYKISVVLSNDYGDSVEIFLTKGCGSSYTPHSFYITEPVEIDILLDVISVQNNGTTLINHDYTITTGLVWITRWVFIKTYDPLGEDFMPYTTRIDSYDKHVDNFSLTHLYAGTFDVTISTNHVNTGNIDDDTAQHFNTTLIIPVPIPINCIESITYEYTYNYGWMFAQFIISSDVYRNHYWFDYAEIYDSVEGDVNDRYYIRPIIPPKLYRKFDVPYIFTSKVSNLVHGEITYTHNELIEWNTPLVISDYNYISEYTGVNVTISTLPTTQSRSDWKTWVWDFGDGTSHELYAEIISTELPESPPYDTFQPDFNIVPSGIEIINTETGWATVSHVYSPVHTFDTDIERNIYFEEHPEELTEGLHITSNGNTQRYDGNAWGNVKITLTVTNDVYTTTLQLT